MEPNANLKFPNNDPKTEIILNLINQKLDNIAAKVDKLDTEIDKIQEELLINRIKRKKSLSYFVDVGWEKVLGKGIEYAIMGAIIYVVSHIKI